MRILLLPAPTEHFFYPIFPLALAQLSAFLCEHEVKGFDPNLPGSTDEKLTKLLEYFRPELIGISFRNLDTTQSFNPKSFIPSIESFVQKLKESSPDSSIVLGGTAFSLFPEELLERLHLVDYGFFMEAEKSFSQFVTNPDAYKSIPGICYRDSGEVVCNDAPARTDVQNLLLPDFDLFRVKDYTNFNLAIGLETKRGCSFQCIHCVYPFLSGKNVRTKKPEKIIEEAEAIVSRGAGWIYWADSVFNIPSEHTEQLCRALIQAKLPLQWGGSFTEHRFDHKMAGLVHEAGGRVYYFSPDGISPEAMKIYGRPVNREEQNRAYKAVKRHKGNAVFVAFLIGSPNEGIFDLLRFTQYLLYLIFKLRIFHFTLSYTRIFPHTRIQKLAIEKGIIREDENLLFPKYYYEPPSSWLRFIIHPILIVAQKARQLLRRVKR